MHRGPSLGLPPNRGDVRVLAPGSGTHGWVGTPVTD
jgi:hypothetical protein